MLCKPLRLLSMKTILTILTLCMFATIGKCDDRLIPFDDFFISMETNGARNHNRGFSSLYVMLFVERSKSIPKGRITSEVLCFQFENNKQNFTAKDIELLMEACVAAKRGEEFMQLSIDAENGNTVFESIKRGHLWLVQVNRGDKVVFFDSAEGAKVKKAIREVDIGEAWFERLLTIKKVWPPGLDMRPPIVASLSFGSPAGIVEGRGLIIEHSLLANFERGKTRYRVSRKLKLRHNATRSTSSNGGRVERFLEDIEKVLESSKKGEALEIDSLKDRLKYTIKTNLFKKEADVVILDSVLRKKRSLTAHFDQEDLIEIKKINKAYEAKKQWFEKHEALFLTHPENVVKP